MGLLRIDLKRRPNKDPGTNGRRLLCDQRQIDRISLNLISAHIDIVSNNTVVALKVGVLVS